MDSLRTVECGLCRKGRCPYFAYGGPGTCDYCGAEWIYDETDTLTEKSLADIWSRIPKWIPVAVQLPPRDVPVLCCWSRQLDGMGVARVAAFNGSMAWREIGGFDEVDEPIAWMPLPVPPKEQS